MKQTYFCIVYKLDADGYTDYGIYRNSYYLSRKDARKEMREIFKDKRKELKSDYGLEDFDDSRKADRCAFSADGRVYYEIEVVEIRGTYTTVHNFSKNIH